MSSKSNVNPDHYKVGGRDRPVGNAPGGRRFRFMLAAHPAAPGRSPQHAPKGEDSHAQKS